MAFFSLTKPRMDPVSRGGSGLFTAFHALLLYCLWDVKVGALTPRRPADRERAATEMDVFSEKHFLTQEWPQTLVIHSLPP